MNAIKLVVSDIDGTLVPIHTHVAEPEIVDAIRQIEAGGGHVAIASARPAAHVTKIAGMLGLRGPQVIDGGATVYDFDTHEVLWQAWLTPDRLQNVARAVIDHAIVIDAFPELRIVKSEEFSIDHIVSDAPYVYVQIDEAHRSEIWERLSKIPDIAFSVPATEPHVTHVQICDISATKQHGVEQLQRIMGVSAPETLAIGDGYNDIPLFAVAAHRVAMGNAVDELKEKATYVTDTVQNLGWAKAMMYQGLVRMQE